jgi:hypothetical protein
LQIVKRIVEVATDPQKVAELKVLLSVLCHETSYEAECRLFVSKIDLFLDKLLPFLVGDFCPLIRIILICA